MTGDALQGAWRLSSYSSTDLNGGDTRAPLGARPQGLILYSGTGWMSAQLAARARAPYADGSVHGGTVEERALAAAGMVSYGGRYRLRGDVVTHTPTVSLLPHWIGLEVPRRFRIEGDLLVLDMLEALPGPDGPRLGSVIWQRVG